MTSSETPPLFTLSRRSVLRNVFAAACMLPFGSGFAESLPTAPTVLNKKRLIVFSLYGGNDGLNTVVPFRDPLYKKYRPNLALSTTSLLPIDDDVALNPELQFLRDCYERKEVAIIQDVGYAHPNLSHFESRAIWDSANPALGTRASSGWYANLVMSNRDQFDAANLDAAAISFLSGDLFASGNGVAALNTSNIRNFLTGDATANRLPDNAPEAQRYLSQLIDSETGIRERLRKRLQGRPLPEWEPYEDPVQIQLKMVEYFLKNSVQIPALKIIQSGFDTHTGQFSEHPSLLRKSDNSLKQLVTRLKEFGAWNDTVILVYSEFGRRPTENGGGGTDHGTAGPAFLLGGGVRGGLYGQRADLGDLDENGNLKFSTDFRRIYTTIARQHFQLSSDPFSQSGFSAIEGVLV